MSKLEVGGEPFTMTWSADGGVLMVGTKVFHPRDGPVGIHLTTEIGRRAHSCPDEYPVLSRNPLPPQAAPTDKPDNFLQRIPSYGIAHYPRRWLG